MSNFRSYEFELTGLSSMLMHCDNFDWAARCAKWSKIPDNSKRCTNGDDRTPGFIWLGSCYRGIPEGYSEPVITLPTPVLSACLRDAGRMMRVGKGNKTYKAATQSGMAFTASHLALEVNGQVIPWTPVALKLQEEFDFQTHLDVVEAAGFKLNVQRVKVMNKRHIRVRPEIENWKATGTLIVADETLVDDVISEIFQTAGNYKGVGDWRPGCITPGPYGRFELTKLEQVD